jgi:probable HAF family extracellular repeat protein
LILLAAVLAIARCGPGGKNDSSIVPPGDAGGSPDGGGSPDAGGSPDGGGGGIPDAGPPAPGKFRLNLHLSGQGSGHVVSQPPGIDCPGKCSADFDQGQVMLSERADPGSGFAYWAGVCPQSSTTTCTANLFATVAGNPVFEAYAVFEPPPPVTYSVREIPKSDTAHALNAAGNATGVGAGGSGSGDAFFFDAATGQTTFLSFSAREGSHAQAINDGNAMVVNVFSSSASGNVARTVRWENGAATELGTLGGNTWGYGINNSKEVVGWFVRTDGSRTYSRAFLHDGQRMLDLGSLDSTCSEAHSINAAGIAVGNSCAGAQFTHAVIFRRNAPIEDLTPSNFGWADAISDSGYIAGRIDSEGFIRAPGGSLRTTGGLPGGSGSWLHGVNDSGLAVGLGYVPAYSAKGYLQTAPRAAIWLGGRLWDLSYMTGIADLDLIEAFAINRNGQIVARGSRPGASGGSFLLTPK